MSTFLRAEWRKLVMANYAVDSKLLAPHLPHKTELDIRNGVCYVSLVGFMFRDTRIKGFRIPFHTNFEEVNLRFYVRHRNNAEWKRGVVFLKEIVPRPALAFVANTVYRENYEAMPMEHSFVTSGDTLEVEYRWRKKKWHSLKIRADKKAKPVTAGSDEEFITEHYWGYTRIDDTATSEYRVEHPKWEIYSTRDYFIDVDFPDVYGHQFEFLKTLNPVSVFLAEGSCIEVKRGRRIS